MDAFREPSLNERQIESMEMENSNGSTTDTKEWNSSNIALSIGLFIIAGLFEIGGGYLMWIGLRDKVFPALCITFGAMVLVVYGIIPTFQPFGSFGRTFAVYGGFFIVLSYVWAAVVDGFRPDKGDIIGATIAIIGVCIAWFWPR
jgi:drug/metabolite transporter superfamily protein YnfA